MKNCPLAYSFQRPMAYNHHYGWWLEVLVAVDVINIVLGAPLDVV